MKKPTTYVFHVVRPSEYDAGIIGYTEEVRVTIQSGMPIGDAICEANLLLSASVGRTDVGTYPGLVAGWVCGTGTGEPRNAVN